MKHTGLFNRFLSVLLVVAMLVGNVLPALATGTDGENTSGTNISFTRVDNSEVTAGLTPSGKTEITNEEEYEAKEMVRVSIILKKASTLEAGFSTMDLGRNNAAMAYSDSLKNEQRNVIQQIERTISADLDVVWNLTLVANMISAYVEYGQIEAIKKLPGVKNVVLESEYAPNKVEFSDSIAYMGTSGLQIGSNEAWTAGYTGAGMRIAVIDTGIDTDHQSLNAMAYEYALEQLAEQKDMTKEAYMESLELLDAEEIASVANRLNVEVDPALVSVSSKIAYAYNYRDFDYDVTHDNDEEGDHGSHVAGIATANSWLYNPASGNYGKAMDYCFMQGVAPEAQLLVMKVFGKGGSPYDSDFFAAIEDAIVLGADAINLSLGSTVPGRGHHTNAEFQKIMDDLTHSGVVVAISAGNAGAWVEYAENGYLYNTDVSMDTVSQPGSFTNALCVASVENDGMVGYYLDVNGQVLVYNEDNREGEFSNRPFREIAGEYEYIFIDGVGKKADWDAVASVLPGKIAVCSRGETNFVEKATLAVEAGAVAVLIYNNQSGIITLDLTEYLYSNPVAALTKKQGERLRELSTPVTNSAGTVLYYTGTMKVMNDFAMGHFGSEYYTMSNFSSWGVPGSLEMKPEITAPGGNIFSIEGMNKSGAGYAIKSGTSMASPQVAGMAALLAQYVQENDLTDKTGLTARQLIQSLLMSTATPLLAQQDRYWSILQQGAGLANVNDAINADSYIMMGEGTNSGAADGKVKVELFDDPDRTGSYSATFTISNLTNVEKAINLSADFFIQSLLSDDEGYLYMDTATAMIPMNVIWTIGGARVTSDTMDMSAMDFNGDGLVNVDDGQLLLDYATGKTVVLQNQNEADVDGDGDIDSHDAYVFLSNLSTTTAVLPANGSVEIRVDFSLSASMKDQLEQMYPNGTYLQGYLYAETEDTTHSIPVLGFYGNWTDASMFDVGTWPTYDTGEDTRIPYTGILRGNDFQIRYADDPNYHYTLGGNPVITDTVYMPERNSINSSNYIHGIRFTPIRHADQSRVLVVNNTTGSVILDQKTGAVNMAYYPNELYGWQNAMMILETNFSLKNTSENDEITMSFTLVPEYYIDESGNVDWDALGEGASRHMDLVIDNTAPELKGVSVDVINNTMTIVASDNQYVAAVGLYNKTGTRRLAAAGSKQDIEKGETAEYTFSLDGINGKKFLVQVHDYAMNTVTYLLEMQIGEDAGVPDMMAYDLVQRHWTTFTKDFVYDYKVGTPRLEYADHTYYAATIAEHYVFASTNKGELYVMPEDDLSDTTFVVNMGVVLHDMAYNKADGQIYAVTEGNNLVVIDKLSGALTKVAEMPKRTNTLACSPEGVFYFNELGTGRIWSCTLETLNAPVMLMEDAYLTEKDPISGDRNGTEGNMGMEYDPNRNMICWNSHLEILAGSYITFAYYYEIDPATGNYTRYNDFWHEMSCLMIPDETGKTDNWAEPTDKVTAVSLNKSSVEIIKGTTAKVIANVQPWTATDRDVIWSSADTSIATVDENGLITGIAPGTTWITATSKLDPTKTASCEVTVNLLQVTINGTVIDTENNAMFYSWNMAEDNTWTAGAAIPVSITSATYSPALNAYYMMEITEALKMHRVAADGSLQASAVNENSIPLWDMAYSEVFSTEQTEMVTSIYYSYLLSAKDPMALDAVGFDLGAMCSYLVGITSMGYEQVEGEDGTVYDTEHLLMMDNDGYIWDFWVYARDGGGYDALYNITGTDLRLEYPGYDNMEHMFTSLMVGEDGNLYLAAYTGETSELYHLAYDEIEEKYLAVKIGDMGDNIWPATITSVTVNGGSVEPTVASPAPKYTMSATTISREQMEAAASKVRFAVTEEEKDFKLGVRTAADEYVVNGDGTQASPIELVVGSETFALESAGLYFTFTAPSAGLYTITITPEEGLALRLNVNGETTSVYEEPGQVELGANETVTYWVRLFVAGGSKYVMKPGNVTITITSDSNTPEPEHNCVDTNPKDHVCDNGCELPQGEHADSNEDDDHICDYCGSEEVLEQCADAENDGDHKCDVCGETVSQCNTDGFVEHKDAKCDEDGVVGGTYCTICNNGKAEAEEAIPAAHNYVEGICSGCGAADPDYNPEHTCADADNDHKCDTCSAPLSECAEGDNKDHKCDVCGATLSECAEGDNKDHKCDVCGATLSECAEGDNKDHKCDVCGATLSECAEGDNKDHKCDVCSATLSECAEGDNKDHKCDVCGATVSQCNTDGFVEHKDAKCDEDGVVGGTYCTICNNGKAEAEEAIPAGHNYVDGTCSRCGQEEAEQNILVLGNNTLESGKVYTYTVANDGGLQMVFSNLLGSDGGQIIDYVYGRGLRVRIMLNGNPVYRIKDETRDNETKITVSAGDKITLELVPVDSAVENHFVVTLNLSEATPPVALNLGENSLAMKTYYSFIAPTDGTLYTTIKELYYDGSYVSEVSLNSTVVFKINGVVYKQFRNQIEVKAGDEISFQLDASFKNHSTNAFLDLSYEGFYEHPIGTRGNPYTVAYSDCPTETVKIPGGTYVWYKLIGFSADAYLTITGENAYAIVGGTRVDARNGSLTIPAYSTLQIGNAGAQEMSYQLSAYIPEGTHDNPKDLVAGNNSATVGERESYYFDHVATQSGKMTAVISGSNWMYEVFWYAADGALMQSVGPKYGFQGDAAQFSVNMSTGQTVVIRVTTMTSSFSQPGGTVSVNFQFTPSGGTTPEPGCQHPNAATIAWQYNDNQHWKVCDSCQQQIFTASHSYENGVCVCGKTDPNAGGTTPGCQHSNAAGQWQFNDNQHWQICDSCQQQFNVSSHGHGNWVNGKKTCFCGHQITCDHANVGAWQSDNNEHWQICGTCGLTVNRASHSYGADNKCVCGKEKPDSSVVVELKNEVDTTNGVVKFTWDPAKMTLVNIQIHTDYFSMVEAEGSLTVGYISLNAIEAGKTIVTLTFEAVDPADADVSIVHKEINNSTVTECVHTSVTYTVSKAPTTAKTGALEGVCGGCGETFSVTLPALNIVDYTYQVIEPATETKDGTGRYTWKVTTYGTFSFDVVIPHDVTEQDAQVVIESSTAVVGGILRLEVLLQNNPGIQALSLLMNYDASVMSFVGVSNGAMMDLDVNTGYNRLLWSANAETTTDGVLCVLEFRINENAQVGTYTIDLTLEQAVNGQGQEVQLHMVSANIEIVDMVFGDANADGVVDLVDLVLLRSYLANRDPETGISSQSVTAGADANGDGTIGLADVMLLRQYLVNRNPATGESSVVLGPQN